MSDRHPGAKEHYREAFQEALKRYPTDVESALTFFAGAIGLMQMQPTEADIAWAKDVMARSETEGQV